MSHQPIAKISPPAGGAEPSLVAAARAGDRDAFAHLYNEHHEAVFRFLMVRTRDRYLAEDLTQEVFVRVLRRISSFTWQGREFGAWLFTIARNLVTDHFKSARARREFSVGEIFESDERDRSAEAQVFRDLEVVETRDAVHGALALITPDQRKCVTLRYLTGLSIEQTASAMGKRPGAVKTLAYRAMRSMEQVLGPESTGVAA